MNTIRRLGLQAWLGVAFVLLGAIASLVALAVVLPNLEGPIRADQARKTEESTTRYLERLAEEPQSKSDLTRGALFLSDRERADTRVSVVTATGTTLLAQNVQYGYLPSDLTDVARTTIGATRGEITSEFTQVGGTDVVRAAVKVAYRREPPNSGLSAVLFEVAVPVEGTASRLAAVRSRVLVAIALVLALALVMGLFISHLLGSRIRRLASTAVRLARGDLSARARVQSPAEVSSLAGSINTMASRLESLVDETVSDRDRAQGLVASLAEGVVAVNDRGEVTVANDAARTLLAIPRRQVPLTLADLPDSVRQAWEEARDGLEETSVVEATLPGGREILMKAACISREAGVVITIRDVTEERQLNRARRDLIANVSHELKTPLTAVKGFLELLENHDVDPERRREFFDLMGNEVHRLERLIAEQLELARIDAGALPLERAPHDLAELAVDIVDSRRHLAERENVDLVTSLPPAAVIADVDPARVEQMLLILLDNALKHTPAGGKITVAVGREGSLATITVRDTGSGVPPEAQPFIFDRFYQADEAREGAGLGLGLSIARGLAEAHGGSVDLRSASGVGSVFIVRLPVHADATAPAGIPS